MGLYSHVDTHSHPPNINNGLEMKRTRSSARFDPYFKVQWYDNTSLTWRDIQESHSSQDLAEQAFPLDKQCRVMEITMKGRKPLV